MRNIVCTRHLIFIVSLILTISIHVTYAMDSQAADPERVYAKLMSSFPDLRAADEKLNSVYKDLAGRLSNHDKDNLIQSQRNWLKYRNSEMIKSSDIDVIKPVILKMINARISEISEHLPPSQGSLTEDMVRDGTYLMNDGQMRMEMVIRGMGNNKLAISGDGANKRGSTCWVEGIAEIKNGMLKIDDCSIPIKIGKNSFELGNSDCEYSLFCGAGSYIFGKYHRK
ncbi:MAG: lysozyme inhibitor LprI family protein [Syntrophobacteraceae bacterium]